MEHAFHIAFVADASIITRAREALRLFEQTRDPDVLSSVLEEAHQQRRHRQHSRTARFAESTRRGLVTQQQRDTELAAAVTRAPQVVRELALTRAKRLSGLLVRLRELDAPPVVRDSTREQLLDAIARLDPTTPLPPDPEPTVGTLHDASGVELTNVHDWLGQVLAAVFDPMGGLCGLGRAIHELPPATSHPKPFALAAGIEFTTYGMSVDAPVWHRAEITLPNPLHGASVVAAGVGGGPVSYALSTDDLDNRTHETLARGAATLGPDESLVSFVSVENDIEWPWEGLHGH